MADKGQIWISEHVVSHDVAFVLLIGNQNVTKVQMDLTVLDYCQHELFNEFWEFHLNKPQIRLIVKGLNEIGCYNYDQSFTLGNIQDRIRHTPNVLGLEDKIFECVLNSNDGMVSYVSVLIGGLRSAQPDAYMNQLVRSYAANLQIIQFVESHLDMPQLRIIISGANGVTFTTYNPNVHSLTSINSRHGYKN